MITAKHIIDLTKGFIKEAQQMSTVTISGLDGTPAGIEGLEKTLQKELMSPALNTTRSNDNGTLSFDVVADKEANLQTMLTTVLSNRSMKGSVSVKNK